MPRSLFLSALKSCSEIETALINSPTGAFRETFPLPQLELLVLVVKLRQSHTSDLDKARKATRAAIVLLPLLGITNLLQMTNHLEKSAFQFALWSYTTHFLTSFQGFFIAMLYCFLNGEVRSAIMKSLSVYLSIRGYEWRQRRQSMYSAAYATAPDTEANFNNAER